MRYAHAEAFSTRVVTDEKTRSTSRCTTSSVNCPQSTKARTQVAPRGGQPCPPSTETTPTTEIPTVGGRGAGQHLGCVGNDKVSIVPSRVVQGVFPQQACEPGGTVGVGGREGAYVSVRSSWAGEGAASATARTSAHPEQRDTLPCLENCWAALRERPRASVHTSGLSVCMRGGGGGFRHPTAE